MKAVLLLAISITLFSMAYGQPKRTKEGLGGNNGDTTWHSGGPYKRQLISNGRKPVHSEPGKYTLYATYKNKKLTGYQAVDSKGNNLPVNTIAKESGGKFKCFTCVRVCNDAGKCADDCTEISCPDDIGGAKATTNERPKPEDPDQGGEIFNKAGKKSTEATRKVSQ